MDADHGILPNGISVDLSGSRLSEESIIAHSGRYATLRGTFNKSAADSRRQTSGNFTEITWVVPDAFWGRGDSGVSGQ